MGPDAKLDECIGEVLNTLGPGGLKFTVWKKQRGGERTKRKRCSVLGVLHLGERWQPGQDISKQHEEEKPRGSCREGCMRFQDGEPSDARVGVCEPED